MMSHYYAKITQTANPPNFNISGYTVYWVTDYITFSTNFVDNNVIMYKMWYTINIISFHTFVPFEYLIEDKRIKISGSDD